MNTLPVVKSFESHTLGSNAGNSHVFILSSPMYGSNTSHYLHNTASESHAVATPVLFTSRLSGACYMPSHGTILDFITLIIFGNDSKL
jgi:hypothetical protein